MKSSIFIFWLIMIGGCNAQIQKLSEKEFTKIFKDSLDNRYPKEKFLIQKELVIKAVGEKLNVYLLNNCYNDYLNQPDSIKNIISKYLESTKDISGLKKKIEVTRIIPIIMPGNYLEVMKEKFKQSGFNKELELVYQKYNDQLLIVFGEDEEKRIGYFSKEDFSKLKISRDTLLEFSIKNLKKRISRVNKIGTKGSYGIEAGGNFESSIILFQEFWNKKNFDVDGDIVIAIPNRDILIVTGSNDQKSLDAYEKLAVKSFNEGSYPLSPYLFKWNGKGFERFN